MNLDYLMLIGLEGWFSIISLVIFLYLFFDFRLTPRHEYVHKRIESMNIFSTRSEKDKIMKKSLSKRLFMMLNKKVAIFMEKHMERGKLAPLKLKLRQAKSNLDPTQHYTKKVIYAIVCAGMGLFTENIAGILGLALIGFLLPDRQLNTQIEKVQLQIKGELPDFLDLLAATTPSANNLEDAIARVCKRTDGIVSDEFKIVLDELNTGKKRRDALKDMAKRCAIPEIDTLISQINQSEQFGTPVERTLEVQAEKMRKLKKVLAEIKARKASVLLILPSVFLLMTSIIVIAGPSVVGLLKASNNF